MPCPEDRHPGVTTDEHRVDEPAAGRRDVAVSKANHWVAVAERDAAPRAGEGNDDSLPGKEKCEGHDERRDADSGDQEARDAADRSTGRHREEHADPDVLADMGQHDCETKND